MTPREYESLKLLVKIAEDALEANLNDYYDKHGRQVFEAIEYMRPKLNRYEKKAAGFNIV